ncbi:putative intracellular septation protein A [Variibacter gotjawalensis]|uniref:Inner membrane-spanning protein YciB n=1 Tax=Variibacter gotjawalensis TaxID=1333996 RepID=A0A0S3PRY7_9BRAD|nr:septation protein A [Variibacter gotjawalensis]NIK48970.1 intracellular septation protein [Variibacter gotjawalensis]RZS50826.1 intracellular septation protein [Variibacter gotjawalensis]BAT58660.1 putative intracellular septation protein A [Variibacter gotjawalensis]
MSEKKSEPPLLRLALELGPLLLFFLVYSRVEMYTAIIVFMIVTAIAMAISFALTRHISTMSTVSAVIVFVFGGLTLYLHDETFFKMKPTIIYGLFAATLLGGLLFGKTLLQNVFGTIFEVTPAGWRVLTQRWGLFFLFLALLNEVVWRTMSTDFWVKFKVFGIIPLIFIFGMLQASVLDRYAVPKAPEGEKS